MARVYLDTSFVSACVTTREDPSSIVRRETSQEWMQIHAPSHELWISAEVIKELGQPSFPGREAALRIVKGIPLIQIDEATIGLATVFVREQVMPGPIGGDSVHVAACRLAGMQYLLTWNIRHLANPNKLTHLRTVASRAGVLPPTIVTPDLLWES